MTKILERYIGRSIILATSIIALIITAVLFLLSLLGQLKSVGEGDYGFNQAIFFVLLQLPNELYAFSPMVILLGSIMGLSFLTMHRELAVMRAYGFSTRHIIISVLATALLVIIVLTGFGEGIGPDLSYQADVQKQNAENAGQSVITSTGVWLHLDNNFLHIDNVIDRKLLQGVTRYQFDDKHRLQVAYYAKTMALSGNRWLMIDVVKTSFYNERTKSLAMKLLPWDIKFNPNLLNAGLDDPDEMNLPKLAKYSHYLARNGLQAAPYQYNFWRRVLQPFSSLVMIFLAIPFVLGAINTTLTWRIIVGILVGFAFFVINEILGQASIVYQIPTMLAALLPPLLFAGVGVLLCKRLIKN